MKKVFITRKFAGSGEKLLKEKGFSVKVYKRDNPITRTELLYETKNADALITLLTDKIDNNAKINRP